MQTTMINSGSTMQVNIGQTFPGSKEDKSPQPTGFISNQK